VGRGDAITASLRSCIQDAVIIIAQKLKIEAITKDAVYKAFPPHQTQDTSLQQVLDCNLIDDYIDFSFENYNQSKGGPEYSLLQIQSGPPRLVLADFPDVKEKHAFVYDTEEGSIIDNRKMEKSAW
jgi:hypothetical protein